MTIYIVSYTSYSEYDNYIFTSQKPFADYAKAFNAFKDEQRSAYNSISENYQVSKDDYHELKMPSGKGKQCFCLERQDDYMKIIVELTEHEI